MTEIPEHLLKRSRERRAALGLGGDAPAGAPAEGESAAAATPAPAAAATPAPRPAAPVEEPKPEPPKPEPEYIQAAKRRRKVPIWAMPVLVFMPLWGYMFVRTLEPPPAGETDPFVLGTTVYSPLLVVPRRHGRRLGRHPQASPTATCKRCGPTGVTT